MSKIIHERDEYKEGSTLTPEEIKEHVKNTPKMDIDAMHKSGKYRKFEDYFNERGLI